MREILFKAKKYDHPSKGQWITGSLIRKVVGGNEHFYIHAYGDMNYRVDDDTICQISEFQFDKHQVSEGDLFKMGELEYVVVFENGAFQMNHTKKGYSFDGRWGLLSRLFDADMESFLNEIEHVGNIYDKKSEQ